MIQLFGVILLVVTSKGEMENGKPTGLWLEEFAVPYEVFTEAGYEVIVVSPEGGAAPVDPRSLPENPTPAEKAALERLKNTRSLKDLKIPSVDAIFFAGGHGTMFDFPVDKNVSRLVTLAFEKDLPLGLVCHGPAALVGARTASGEPVAKGRQVTGFTNREEDAVNLTESMPFLLESKLREQGATFSSAENFKPHVVVDGNLVTGQNPASSRPAAEALLKQISRKP
ncbi:MAG: type 1 glutamine amidotransferase domain-containing protein [Kiritimatiellia bacterium]